MTGDPDRLRTTVSEAEDLLKPMSTVEYPRPEEATAPAERPRAGSRDPRRSIEERYELETTLTGLGLDDDGIAVPIGADDRYLLRELLGRGSMGAVYLADDVELDRKVAIKVVARRVEHDHLVLRLRREARALAQVDHPNVIKVFDIGNENGERFIAMELVKGKTLREWQQGRPFGEVIDAYLDAGRGLAAAHACAVVHRDIKPDNVLVDEKSGALRVRVGDFGLAGYELDDAVAPGPAPIGLRTSSKALLGTLPYMSPEQLRREVADARSDQHQYCVALWEAVVGKRPFDSLGRPLGGDTSVPPCPAALPRWLYGALARGLAFGPGDRFPSMDALISAIERGRRWRRARPWLAAVGVIAALGSGAWAIQPDACAQAASPMASIWSAEARADIEAAFGPADDTSEGTMTHYLVSRLDDAAAGWSERSRQVCEAREHASAVERPAIEQRATCLDRWADRMQRRIQWLRHPDEAHMSQAFELVAPLGLAGDSCVLPPIEIDEQVEEAIDEAEQAELLRDLDGARELASAAVELASARGTPCAADGSHGEPRSSEQSAALFRLGHVLSEVGDAKGSLDALTQAHLHAHACNDEHRNADALTHVAKVLALDFDDVAGAALAAEDAWVALRHVQEPSVSLRRYDERMAAGVVAEHRGAYEAAREHAEEGRAALGDPDAQPILAAKLEINVGVAFHKEGRFAEAAEAFARATTLVGDALGPQHPQARLYAARQALNLGLAALKADDVTVMRQQFEVAAASSEPWVVSKALTAWVQGEYMAKNEPAAIARISQLLAFLATGPDLPPITLATAEATAGQILVALEQPGGIPVLERACARWRELGRPHEIGACELSLGEALVEAERLDEARRVLERLRLLDVSPTGPLPAAIGAFEQTLKPAPTITQGLDHP